MSKIVDKYIELDELFKQCTKNQSEGNIQPEEIKLYQVALDNFINEARNHYSNNSLDLNTAISLFNNDAVAQEELTQCVSKSKKHL